MHRLTRLSLQYPKAALAILFASTVLLAAGLPRARSEFGYRVLLGDNHDSIERLDALIEQFGGGLPIRIAWECGPLTPCEHALDADSLDVAHTIVTRLSAVDGIRDIRGPSNAPLLVPAPDGFSVRRFVENDRMVEDAADLKRFALEDPIWNGELINADATVAVVIIQPSDTKAKTEVALTEEIEELLEELAQRGFLFHVTGDAYENTIGGRDLAQSSARIIPFTVLVIGLVVLILCGSLKLSGAILATMAVALIWTFGALGWAGWPRDGILEVLAPLVLVVGVCDAMHFVSRYISNSEALEERHSAVVAAAKDVGGACFVTTLTTAGAFLSFTSSDLETFVRFGLISTLGVIACLVLTFTLLPTVLLRTDLRRSHSRVEDSWAAALGRITEVSATHSRAILITSLLAGLFFALGWNLFLRVDTNWLESWGERSELTQSIRFMEDRFGASETLELRISLPPGASAHDADVLASVSALASALEETGGFESTTSVVEVVKRLNRLVHDDDPAFERIPDAPGAGAELFELATLDDGGLLAGFVSLDRSQLRISARSPQRSYTTGSDLVERTSDLVRSISPQSWDVDLSGELTMTVEWMRDVQTTQLRSFPLAFLIVLVIVSTHLRSIALGLAAMLPTLLPVVLTLGAMGWLGMSLDVGRAMIAAVLIGIGVDDAVHVLNQYARRRSEGTRPDAAIAYAIFHTGRAVVTTSLALSLGFLTLMASAWQTISSFGFFLSIAIIGALLATLYVLPAVVLVFARERDSE